MVAKNERLVRAETVDHVGEVVRWSPRVQHHAGRGSMQHLARAAIADGLTVLAE
jgi:hypothetical protein